MKAITKLSQLDVTKQYTYADYLTWKFAERVELIKGWILQMSPAPNLGHQKVSANLFLCLGNFFDNQTCTVFSAPFDVRLFKKNKNDEKVTTVVQPDICVICDSKKLDEKGAIGSPELIVEIISPGNSKRDLKIKFDLYEENGVLEYWVVNPLEKNVQQFYLQNKKFEFGGTYYDNEMLTSHYFKTLTVSLHKVFRNL